MILNAFFYLFQSICPLCIGPKLQWMSAGGRESLLINPKSRAMPFGDSIRVPWASSSLASNERQNSLPRWKLLNMQSIKRGSRIEISRSPDVRLHWVAPPPSFPPRHQPCLQTPATPAKIGPNSTTVELNSLKFKWEMSFHWSCKYWKWAGLKIGWMCVMHLNPWSKERFPLTNQRLFCFPVKFVKQSGRWAD